MLASWLQSRFGISISYCFFVHVPTSLEEGVLQDPTLNLLVYHFVKSFLWTRAILVILSVPLSLDWFYFHDVFPQGVSMSSNCNWSLEPMNGSWETHSHRKLLLQELEDLQHLKASPHHDSIQSCHFFPQKVTDFYIWINVTQGPRCGFYMSTLESPPAVCGLFFFDSILNNES